MNTIITLKGVGERKELAEVTLGKNILTVDCMATDKMAVPKYYTANMEFVFHRYMG